MLCNFFLLPCPLLGLPDVFLCCMRKKKICSLYTLLKLKFSYSIHLQCNFLQKTMKLLCCFVRTASYLSIRWKHNKKVSNVNRLWTYLVIRFLNKILPLANHWKENINYSAYILNYLTSHKCSKHKFQSARLTFTKFQIIKQRI